MKNLLCLSGSLRQSSSSSAFIRAISEALRSDAETGTFDIGTLPHYNADVIDDLHVGKLNAALSAADGVIIVTPEYNYSIPGVLKNAIDWASRPAYNSAFRDKPVFVISVSGGAMGGVRAQAHLKYILSGVLARVFPWQEVVVPQAAGKIVDGEFKDDAVIEYALEGVRKFIGSL